MTPKKSQQPIAAALGRGAVVPERLLKGGLADLRDLRNIPLLPQAHGGGYFSSSPQTLSFVWNFVVD